MRFQFRKKGENEEAKEQPAAKTRKMMHELFPGKTPADLEEMYRSFRRELDELLADEARPLEDILACMDRYGSVLEIADLFPEPGMESWADYREGARCICDMEE